jgi:hypothetical protein
MKYKQLTQGVEQMDNSKKYQRQIVIFIEGIDGIKRHEFVHGTLYLKLEEDRDCDFIHTEIRKFYKGYIDPEGGVNMYAVGDEFAFDFVPEDREAPAFDDEDESPAFPSYNEMPDEVDTILNLEAEAREGK